MLCKEMHYFSVAQLSTFPLSHFADENVCDVTCTTDFISTLNCSNSYSAGTALCYIVANCRYRSSTSCSYFESQQFGMTHLMNHLASVCLLIYFYYCQFVIEKASVVMSSSDEYGPVEGNCTMKSPQSWCTMKSEELQLIMTYDTNCSITAMPMRKQGVAETPVTKNMLLYKSSK